MSGIIKKNQAVTTENFLNLEEISLGFIYLGNTTFFEKFASKFEYCVFNNEQKNKNTVLLQYQKNSKVTIENNALIILDSLKKFEKQEAFILVLSGSDGMSLGFEAMIGLLATLNKPIVILLENPQNVIEKLKYFLIAGVIASIIIVDADKLRLVNGKYESQISENIFKLLNYLNIKIEKSVEHLESVRIIDRRKSSTHH